jgi:hypothetical protein
MNRSRLLLVGAVLIPLIGCTWLKEHMDRNPPPKGGDQVQPVKAEQLVGYINDRGARLQTLDYDNIRVVASDRGLPMPALRGSLAASQPRNFRMTGAGGAVGAKVDLGSNTDQFWMYLHAPATQPMFVFASHTDFESGKARLPPHSPPFEPVWVMQALGMTTLSPNNQYTVTPDQAHRTYVLSWRSVVPNGTASGTPVIKEIVFEADRAVDPRPQVKKHVVRDTKNKVICTAEIRQAKTAPTGATDPRTNQPQTVQYPTLVVLKWEEQKFEMKLELDRAEVNRSFTDEQARALFSRPTNLGARPVDLAQARYDTPSK